MAYVASAFPVLYLNLGGELMYIIEQRLQAQNIDPDKSSKVLNDLLSTMLNRQFIGDMFRPGQLSPPSAMKALLEKIVHSSIMRLGQDSLDKLFDLVFMAVKFQLFSAPDPTHLLDITQVHVESWKLMTNNPEIILQIQNAQNLLIDNCKKLSCWAWMSIRRCLLDYLQPFKTRVTIFLKKEYQNNAGYFHLDLRVPLPEGISVPQLPGQHRNPYEDLQALEHDAVLLGSNMFNESKQALHQQPKALTPLQGLLIKPAENDEEQIERPTRDVDNFSASTQWESLQLELAVKDKSAMTCDKPVVEEETLLDLFDQATLSE